MKKLLVWLPRGLACLTAGFLLLFSLDVFGEGYGFWQTILAFVMHSIPVFVLVIAIALAWRWPLVGAIIFIAGAILFLSMSHGKLDQIAVISGPLLLVGVLYLLQMLLVSRRRIQ